MTGPWEIEETDDVAMWLTQLTDTQRDAIRARLSHVLERGPRAGRPYVDHVKGSQWNNWYRSAIPRADDLYEEHLRRHGYGD